VGNHFLLLGCFYLLCNAYSHGRVIYLYTCLLSVISTSLQVT
jgi:hypothetical protein